MAGGFGKHTQLRRSAIHDEAVRDQKRKWLKTLSRQACVRTVSGATGFVQVDLMP